MPPERRTQGDARRSAGIDTRRPAGPDAAPVAPRGGEAVHQPQGRPRAALLAIALSVLALSACGTISPGQPYRGGDTVLLCHKGKKTMELPRSALDAHLGHGDRRGRC